MSTHTIAPPLPAKGTFISSVRGSAGRLVAAQNIKIDRSTIEPFLKSISQADYDRLSQDHGHSLPLSFSSPLEELNLLAVLALLNFGSSFRAPLHAFYKRGVFDTIRFFVLSCFLTESDHLSAQGMKRLTENEVASLMGGLPMMVEKPHPTLPGIVVGEPGGRLREFVLMVHGVMTQTGSILLDQGFGSLGEFIVSLLKDAKAEGLDKDEEVSDRLIGGLVETFPAFRDMYMIDDQPVYLFKKALFLLHTISLRFTTDPTNPFPELPKNTTTFLPTFADNVIPSLSVYLNLVELPVSSSILGQFPKLEPASTNPLLRPFVPAPASSSDEKGRGSGPSPKGGPELSTEQATILRSSSVHALQACVDLVRENGLERDEGKEYEWMRASLSDTGLDGYLWAGGKDRADWRQMERFVADSIFY
ncbi:Protein of unknown function DUF2419 [Phaffia rhodozyma]|uniref:Queuosine 5'-phosphate N-glycosylase/hydrolase n=1 Tax=Phaffia rhodozyma TaxID=264483 RepID=A0A0F7SJX0_PHARH|nr:Protein of unknown function DUF2419 [Phaffia rhodozyma]